MISSTSRRILLPPWSAAAALLLLLIILLFNTATPTLSLDLDGALLLAFRYSVLDDPLSALASWNYDDPSPCSWNGVVCMPEVDNATTSRVISLVLPNTRLVGSIPPDLGLLQHLRHLDLSGNSLNGALPPALLNASSSSNLRILSLAGNEISGVIPPVSSAAMSNLQVLNLSDNSFTGGIPDGVANLPNLTVLSLAGNYLSGSLPAGGFNRLQVLDLSSNLLNGSLTPDLAGSALRYLNLSYNKITGGIPPELGTRVPATARIDLSYNNLTGEIPETTAFQSQRPEHFAGNPDLCGRLLNVLCSNPSSPSNAAPSPPTETAPPPSTSPPAIAVIPKSQDGNSPPGTEASPVQRKQEQGGLSPATIAVIVVGDIAGIGLLCLVFLYVYKVKKRKRQQQQQEEEEQMGGMKRAAAVEAVALSSGTRDIGAFSCCMRNKCGCGDGGEETSDNTGSEEEEEEQENRTISKPNATLVMVDGEIELEMETLLRASAYILGAATSTIVYKAVLENGTVLAVRRIGESSVAGGGKMKEFEAQVRSIAKLRHPNLLRVHGFYWAADEKLLISEFAPNGSLANVSFTKKFGSSPFHLGFEARMRIARGVARGLAFLHEKKCVHGSLKPSNILLSQDMEPWIADFGLERLVLSGDKSGRSGASARHFGSKRSVWSQSSLPELSPTTAAAAPSPGGAASAAAVYQAPESLQNLKANPKWDVYSFGVVLLELVSGRAFSEAEVAEWNAGFVEEGSRVVRMADPTIRGEVEGREEALVSCLKLGFSCAAIAPQRRPSMKEALQILERTTLGSVSS